MDESEYETLVGQTLSHLEGFFDDVDPDDVEVSSSDGVLQLDLRGGVRVIVNRQRAARQIWLAAVANAWHFDFEDDGKRWVSPAGDELMATVSGLVAQHTGLTLRF